jgi:hypothetical protein
MATYVDIPAVSSGGGTSPAAIWFNTTAAWAQSLIPTLVSAPFSSTCWDLTGTELEKGGATGSATITQLTTSPGGVIAISSGTTANSIRSLQNRGNVANALISSQRTSRFAIISRVRIAVLAATYQVSLVDVTDGATSEVYFGLNRATSAVNYVARVGLAGTITDLGVAFDGNWHTLAMVADGTNYYFYVGAQDGMGMTQAGAPIAQSGAGAVLGYWQTYNQNLGTAANVEHHVDDVLVLAEAPGNSQ